MTDVEEVPIRPIGLRRLLGRGTVAIGLSLAANWLVLWAVRATDLVPPFGALSVPPVTLLTVLGAAAATAVYGLVTRLSTTPDRTFRVVVVLALLLSFVPDLILIVADPGATVPAVAVLAVMHVVVAAVCLAVLTNGTPVR